MNTARQTNGTGGLERVIEARTGRRRAKIWREHREPYRLLAENSVDVITVLSADATVEYASPSIQKVLGYKPAEFMGKNLLDCVHPDDKAHVRVSMSHQIQIPGAAVLPIEFRVRHKDGSWRFVEAIANNLIYHSGVSGIIVTCRDVTPRKGMEDELRRAYNEMALLTREMEKLNSDLRESNRRLAELSRRDPLTGLYNRNAAIEIVGEHFVRWLKDGTQFSIQIIDVDDFKMINDTYGHLYGDNGLMCLTRAISSSIRSSDMASRLGGDEFLVLLSGTGLDEALEIGKKIVTSLHDGNLELRREAIRITASVGAATVTLADRNVDTLLARADKALYQAKKLGKDQVVGSRELTAAA